MDETTNPVEEPEVADVPVEDTEQPAEDSTLELDEDGNPVEPEPETDEFDEVEYEGKTYKVPKELKDGFLRQGDYTRKTQEIAEQRKQYEAAIQRISEVGEAETQAIRKVAAIEAQLGQYENIDWQAWNEHDPIAALTAKQDLAELRQLHGQAVNEQAQAHTYATVLAQQETAKRLQEGQKVLEQTIPGWGAEKATAIRSFAKEIGFNDDDIAQIDDPRAVQVLHEAMLYRQSQKKTATVKKVEAQQAIQPAATVKGKGGNLPRGLSDDLSTDEWLKRRSSQVRKNRN